MQKDDDDDDATLPFESKEERKKTVEPEVASEEQRKRMAIDITMQDLRGRLNIQNVADLVLLSMVRIPATICNSFPRSA